MESTEDIKNRIKILSDEDFDLEIYDYLVSRYLDGKCQNEKQNQVLATYILDLEVRNGGFDQFYSNNNDKFIDFAIEGLTQFESYDYVNLAKSSKEIYQREGLFTAKRNPAFSELDEKYYELENYSKARLKFIKNHLEEIISS